MRLSEYYTSELGRWRTVWRGAELPLGPYVHGYFGSDGYLPVAVRERHLPNLSVALVVNFSSPHRLLARDATATSYGRRAWIVGLQSSSRLSDAVGTRDFLVAQLTPTGACRLLRERMDSIADQVVELEEIEPLFASRLLARVDAAKGWEARLDALDAAIIERIGTDVSATPFVSTALQRLRSSGGNVDLGRLALDLGCSHKHLIAQFREQVGMTPKAVARLLRFNKAVSVINRKRGIEYPEGKPYLEGALESDPSSNPKWSDLAVACGYFDQAHFIKEFRAFSGCSPSAFLRELSHDADRVVAWP